jgi:hypothetical protein
LDNIKRKHKPFVSQESSRTVRKTPPANRLVTEVLEQRWNDKLEALERLQGELDAHSDAAASLRLTKKEAILARISHQIDTISLDLCSHKEFSSLGNTHWYSARSENPL